jgi:hypothetical protein
MWRGLQTEGHEMRKSLILYFCFFLLNSVSIYSELRKLHKHFVVGNILQEYEFWEIRKVIPIINSIFILLTKSFIIVYAVDVLQLK